MQATMRRRPPRDDGFALVEAVVSCALAAIAVAGIASAMATTSKTNQTSRATTVATAFNRERLEEARSIGYDDLFHATGSMNGQPGVSAGNTFDPDGSGPIAAEPLAVSSTGLPALVAERSQDGTTFTARTYLTTTTGTAARRITVVTTWLQQGRQRETSLSSFVAPPSSPLVAAADAFSGQTESAIVPAQVSSRSRRGGGQDAATAASFQPMTGWQVTGASTEASVEPATRHTARARISSATISLPGLTVVANGVDVQLEAVPGSMAAAAATGTVTVNGVPYVNPAADTRVSVGDLTVALNSRQQNADGSVSVSFVRILGVGGSDLRLAWAWLSPVTGW